jgi:hypothetical protein
MPPPIAACLNGHHFRRQSPSLSSEPGPVGKTATPDFIPAGTAFAGAVSANTPARGARAGDDVAGGRKARGWHGNENRVNIRVQAEGVRSVRSSRCCDPSSDAPRSDQSKGQNADSNLNNPDIDRGGLTT